MEIHCGVEVYYHKRPPYHTSLLDQDSNATRMQLLNSQIKITTRKLEASQCKMEIEPNLSVEWV